MTKSRKEAGWRALFKGKSKEQVTAGLFNGWLWVTAKPEPDIGVDMVVEIPHEFGAHAASFLLQIRSHAKQVSSETIKRAAALRISRAVLPGFLLSIDRSSGNARWVCLEHLFSTEPNFKGGGALKVELQSEQMFSLDSVAPPQEFLDAIYHAKQRGALKAAGSLVAVADSMEERYRELDPRLIVEPSLRGKTQVLTLTARSEPVHFDLQMEFRSAEQRMAMKDAFDWGSPAHLGDARLTMSGSPLFDDLFDRNVLTNARMVPYPIWEGAGLLRYSTPSGVHRTEIVEARISRGVRGAELLASVARGLLSFSLRIEPSMTSSAKLQTDFDLIRRWVEEDFLYLPPALRIIEASLCEGEFELSFIDFPEESSSIRFRWTPDSRDEIQLIEAPLRAAAALVSVAKQRGWRIPGAPMNCVAPNQMEVWLAADMLLQGRRASLVPVSFNLHFAERPNHINHNAPLSLVFRNELEVFVGDVRLGGIPAWIIFRNYDSKLVASKQGGGWDVHCTPRENAEREYAPESETLPTP